jgi:excisionase family DNA binding protein
VTAVCNSAYLNVLGNIPFSASCPSLSYRTSCLAAPLVRQCGSHRIPRASVQESSGKFIYRANPRKETAVSKNLTQREMAIATANGISLGLLPRSMPLASAQQEKLAMLQTAPQPAPDKTAPDVLTKNEAAVYLRISVRTLERLVARREIVPTRIGNRPFFPRALLVCFMEKKAHLTCVATDKMKGDDK